MGKYVKSCICKAEKIYAFPGSRCLRPLEVNVEEGMYKICTLRNLLAKSKRGYRETI
jgi:hypothetical protein